MVVVTTAQKQVLRRHRIYVALGPPVRLPRAASIERESECQLSSSLNRSEFTSSRTLEAAPKNTCVGMHSSIHSFVTAATTVLPMRTSCYSNGMRATARNAAVFIVQSYSPDGAIMYFHLIHSSLDHRQAGMPKMVSQSV